MTLAISTRFDWTPYVERFRRGEWRAPIFRDMILDDARELGRGLTFLDIGCGKGFDRDLRLQQSLAAAAGEYVGIEPDPDVPLGPHFSRTHRCLFEEAPLRPGSVHVAFAVMVLEHLPEPRTFWDKVHDVLADGGVFWGFTMDARHYFCRASSWADRLGVKSFYLNWLHGARGVARYENYPVFYRANSPSQVRKYTRRFSGCSFASLSRVGQLDHYVPRLLRPLAHFLDRREAARGAPGTVLAVRLRK
jgi:SAM-dependent methyltransferase